MFFKFKYCYMTTILIFLPANLELSLKNKSSDYYFFLKELSLKRGKRALLKLKLWFYLNLLPRFLIVFFFFPTSVHECNISFLVCFSGHRHLLFPGKISGKQKGKRIY